MILGVVAVRLGFGQWFLSVAAVFRMLGNFLAGFVRQALSIVIQSLGGVASLLSGCLVTRNRRMAFAAGS